MGAGAPREERSRRKRAPKGAGRGAGTVPPRARRSRPGRTEPHTTMSLPAGMERSRDARDSLAPSPQPAQGSPSDPAVAAPPPPPPLGPEEPQRCSPCSPGKLPTLSLLGLALLQLGLGSALVALSFATVWLGSAGKMKNACSAWAGSWAVLCGILALTTYKRPEIILNRLLVLLSLICVPLSFSGFILGCYSIEFVSSVPTCNLMDKENKICFCCEELNVTKCTEVETVLKLYHVNSCSSAHLLLKSELQDEDCGMDSDDFIPPVPPPSYSVASNSSPLQMSYRTPVSSRLSLSNVYVRRIYDTEVFFRVSPPPYPDVESLNSSEQGSTGQITVMNCVDLLEEGEDQDSQAEEICMPSSRATLSSSNESCTSGIIGSQYLADGLYIIRDEYGSWRAVRN